MRKICLVFGGDSLENEISTRFHYKKIVSYTTRRPRAGEIHDKDYHFITNEKFEKMIQQDLFAEYDEYSQKRYYGTLKSDYQDGVKIVVLTPNGLRQLKKNCPNEKIFAVLVEANLGTRVKRYIDRCGVDKFDFDDAGEIFERINRDFGMFLGLEREVDMVIDNSEGADIGDIADEVILACM